MLNLSSMHRTFGAPEWIFADQLVLDLAKRVKEGAKKNGLLAWQYNTVGGSDGITMGNDGKLDQVGQLQRLNLSRNEIFAAVQGNHRRQHRDSHLRSST